MSTYIGGHCNARAVVSEPPTSRGSDRNIFQLSFDIFHFAICKPTNVDATAFLMMRPLLRRSICICMIHALYDHFSAWSSEDESSNKIHSIIDSGKLPFLIKSSLNWPRRKPLPAFSRYLP